GSGVYTASYTPTATGTDNVAIRLSGTAIGGSPYTSVVSTGGASAAQSTAAVPAGAAGSGRTPSSAGRDGRGNVGSGSNDASLVSMTGSGEKRAKPRVAGAGSGVYTASYTPTAAGTDNVTIRLSGTAIGGSPYSSVVSTGGASAARSTAVVPAGTAGSATTLNITVRDGSGNMRSGSKDARLLSVTVSGANTATTRVASGGK